MCPEVSGIGCVIIAPELPHGSFPQPLIKIAGGASRSFVVNLHLAGADLDLGIESSVITIDPITALNMFLFKAVRLRALQDAPPRIRLDVCKGISAQRR